MPLDGSENSVRGLETAITLARNCGATITGFYSIYAPPHSEFKGIGSVGKAFNREIKKFMKGSRSWPA